MSLRFVNFTPDRRDTDEATRKSIRSQAMKDFRRRKLLAEAERGMQITEPSSSNSQQMHAGGRPQQTVQSGWVRTTDSRRRGPRSRPGPPRSLSRTSSNTSGQEAPRDVAQQMLSIIEEYKTWFSTGESLATFDVAHPTDQQGSQMVVIAKALMSIGHLEALNPWRSFSGRRLYKVHFLELVNERLAKPSEGLDDTMLAALAFLTSYEVSRGSAEATLHLKGISQIRHLRHGAEAAAIPSGLGRLLQIIDLTHALYFNTKPSYTHAPTPERRSSPSAYLDSTSDTALDELANFLLDLQDHMENSAEELVLEPVTPVLSPPTHSPKIEVQHWEQYLNSSRDFVEHQAATRELGQPCRLATALHENWTGSSRPSATWTQRTTDELFEAVFALKEETWQGHERLYIRILLISISYTVNNRQRSWYYTHLVRILHHLDEEEWARTRDLTLRFIDMLATSRQPKRPMVNVSIGGIEIVMDRDEAVSQGLQI